MISWDIYRRACAIALSLMLFISCAESAAPQITNVTVLDNTFSATGPYTVTATVTDEGRVLQVLLIYRVNGSEFFSVPMQPINETTYLAEIPGQPVGTRIEYEVAAHDEEGVISRAPMGSEMFVFDILSEP